MLQLSPGLRWPSIAHSPSANQSSIYIEGLLSTYMTDINIKLDNFKAFVDEVSRNKTIVP